MKFPKTQQLHSVSSTHRHNQLQNMALNVVTGQVVVEHGAEEEFFSGTTALRQHLLHIDSPVDSTSEAHDKFSQALSKHQLRIRTFRFSRNILRQPSIQARIERDTNQQTI